MLGVSGRWLKISCPPFADLRAGTTSTLGSESHYLDFHNVAFLAENLIDPGKRIRS